MLNFFFNWWCLLVADVQCSLEFKLDEKNKSDPVVLQGLESWWRQRQDEDMPMSSYEEKEKVRYMATKKYHSLNY